MVTPDQANAFEKGVTTRDQIVAKLGQPNSTGVDNDGLTTDVYMHVQASADAANYVPVIGLLAGGATSHTNTATFTYDKSGVLKTVATTTGQAHANTGLLNQK